MSTLTYVCTECEQYIENSTVYCNGDTTICPTCYDALPDTVQAERVRSLFDQYRNTCDAGEPLDTTLRDMIADLLHLAASFDPNACQNGEVHPTDIVQAALACYLEEVGA